EGGAERQPRCHPDRGARQALVGHRHQVRPAVLAEVPARRRVGARRGEGLDRSIQAICRRLNGACRPAPTEQVRRGPTSATARLARRLALCARISALAAGLIVALASPARADDLVLHEHVTAPGKPQSRVVRGAIPGEGKLPANPTAIRQDEKIIAAPSVSQPPTGSEVVHGQRSFAADRETEARLDYATQQDGTPHYAQAFNPSTLPFNRLTSL